MFNKIYNHKILILDFGSQYTQLIGRRVRDLGVYCEIHPFDVSEKFIQDFAPKGIILSGGHATVTARATPRAPEIVFKLNVPVLGICYGMQTMAAQLGGQVAHAKQREFGYAQVEMHGHSALLNNIEDHISRENKGLLDVWMSHGDEVAALPPDFKMIATTANNQFSGMADEQRHFYGLQFHPEVTHTNQGTRILENFLHSICGCEANWTSTNIIAESIAQIRQQVGEETVLLGLSGGVDSAVVAALLHEAIGEQLICVFVDTGLLRLGESQQVIETFAQHMGIKVIRVDAEARFLKSIARCR